MANFYDKFYLYLSVVVAVLPKNVVDVRAPYRSLWGISPQVIAYFELNFLENYDARETEGCVVGTIWSRSVDRRVRSTVQGLVSREKNSLNNRVMHGVIHCKTTVDRRAAAFIGLPRLYISILYHL